MEEADELSEVDHYLNEFLMKLKRVEVRHRLKDFLDKKRNILFLSS